MDKIKEILDGINRIEKKVDKVYEYLEGSREDKFYNYNEESLDPLEDVIIPEILEYFRFDNVEKTMKALNWCWAGCNGVPDLEVIKERAIQLVREAYNRQTCVSTGGFTAKYVSAEDAALRDGYDISEAKYPSIELSFNVERWESTPVEE